MSEQAPAPDPIGLSPFAEKFTEKYLAAIAEKAGMPIEFIRPGFAAMAKLMEEENVFVVIANDAAAARKLRTHRKTKDTDLFYMMTPKGAVHGE